MEPKPQYELGDVVRLKSGGDPMTIDGVQSNMRIRRRDGRALSRQEQIAAGNASVLSPEYEEYEEFAGTYSTVWFAPGDELRRAVMVREHSLEACAPRRE